GHEFVGFQIALHEGIVGRSHGGSVLQRGGMDVDGVFAAGGVKKECDVIAGGGLGGTGSENGEGILVFRVVAFGVRDAAFDFQVGDGLEGVILREGDPEVVCLCVGIGRDVDLIGEAKTALGGGGVDGASGRRR